MIEQLKIAIKSIGKRKKRAALTMLGVFIGIAAVVALVALGQGLQKTINDQFEEVGADKIIVQAKEVGIGGQFAPGQLKERELSLLDKVPGVIETFGVLFRSAQVEFNNIQRTVFLLSIPETKREVDLQNSFNTWEAEFGRLLTHKDKNKVVIGYNIANTNMFRKQIRVGDKLVIDERKIEVIGVLKKTGDPGMDGSISLPESDVRSLLNESEAYSYLVAQTAANVDPEGVAERIEKRIRKDRHQKEGKEDFIVQTATELIASFNAVLNVIQFVFVGIAAISLLVGGIGIMNTMFTAVLERTREIGVMKAIGARNKDILSMFLIESALLGLVGGLIGLLLGVAISSGVSAAANAAFGPNTLNAYYPMYLIVGVLVFSVGVGGLSGLLPARRASKLKPVDALRYE